MKSLLALFYLVTAAVWIARAWRAFGLLRRTPAVSIINDLPASRLPRISVLIPARDEEENLEACLETFLSQTYPAIEIIVINDHSTDRTPEILARLERRHPGKIRELNAPDRPEGWTGKNWALAHGVKEAKGEWFLFTDADTRHEPHTLLSAWDHAERRGLGLLTLSPRCLTEGFWEKTLQPAALGLLGLWFPFAKANDPRSPVIFGNGQFLLFRKAVYQKTGGHAKVREKFLEDYALFKAVKESGERAEVAIGTNIFGTRMYASFSKTWAGWRRIYLHAFEKNAAALWRKSFLVFFFSCLPFFLFSLLTPAAFREPQGFGLLWGASLPILFLILGTVWKTHQVVGAPKLFSVFHPLAGIVLTGILGDAAWNALRRKEVRWR